MEIVKQTKVVTEKLFVFSSSSDLFGISIFMFVILLVKNFRTYNFFPFFIAFFT